MDRRRTDRIVRWIERGLLAVGSVCLMWVGAISLQAVTYQVGQNARLARLNHSSGQPAADRSQYRVAAPPEASVPIGLLEIPRLGLSAVVVEGDDTTEPG